MIVVALKTHSPDGRKTYGPDEEYEIDDAAAETLIAFELVRKRSCEAEGSDTETKPDGRYKRRDVRVEK